MPRPRRPSRQALGVLDEATSESARRVLYQTNPGPQDAFMASDAEEVLYGGAAGGGKSYALRAWAVRYCMTYPGAQVVLFRRTYRELEDTHIVAIQTEVPSAVAHYSPADHVLKIRNSSRLMFRFCEGDEEVRTYDTTEFDAMIFDELTHFTQFQYTYLLSRCRSTKPWWPGRRVRAGATPLGRGHAWVKERWDTDGAHHAIGTLWRGPVSEGGMTRQFIPARVTDNPKIDPSYMETLRALPEEEYRAKALGDWSVATGQFFQRWRSQVHVCQPFDVPLDWDRWLCHDYGFNAPFATYWFARPPGTHNYWVYREQYGTGVALEHQVAQAFEATDAAGDKLKAVVLDPSLFAKINVKGRYEAPMADEWKRAFSHMTNVVPGNNTRVAGWSLMRTLLDWEEAPNGSVLIPPRLTFFATCANAIRTIPNLITNEHNPEDVDTDGEDHAGDAIRYGVMHAERARGVGVQARGIRLGPRGLVVRREAPPRALADERTKLFGLS